MYRILHMWININTFLMERLRHGNDKNLFKRSIKVIYKIPRDGMLRPNVSERRWTESTEILSSLGDSFTRNYNQGGTIDCINR